MKFRLTYKISAFILAMVLVSYTIYQISVVAYYISYQDYIIKELCVQKENQQGCNGKCYLMKKLTNEASDNNANTPPKNDKKLIENFVFLLAKNTLVNFKCVSDLDIKKITYQQVFKDSLFIEKETPPPKYFI
ncbi:hypothetical protein [Tenacibaculum ovolyticum]|uniref:hypothetical protein n=1 Tax=Tenacibaculum ovolyticum TaxID=104270 RepID=UPI0005BB7187|nr:hypothetical protein [Tenacibaculum ovolyticum]